MQNNASPRPKRRLRIPIWLVVLLNTVIVLFSVILVFCLVMGRPGLTMVQTFLLAKFSFVEEDADLNTAVNKGLNAFIDGLGDRWSYFMEPQSLSATTDRRANNYVGVGITVALEEGGIHVREVTAGGPAEKAGILPGDWITAVDGTSVEGESLDAVSERIQGEAGTQVTITVRHEDGTTADAVCTRAKLQNASASRQMLDHNLGYVRLLNFYSGSSRSFQENVNALLEENPAGLVIDLRSNPGGYVTELEDILDYLLPEGPVFRMKPRWGSETVTESDANCIELPMVVLVNSDTYSAAELLAAQLRESAGAKIVGEQTSGKGYSQMTFNLINGSGVGLSTAEYTTGGGHSLIGEGILPDVELDLDRSIPILGDQDTQLQAAVQLLLPENP